MKNFRKWLYSIDAIIVTVTLIISILYSSSRSFAWIPVLATLYMIVLRLNITVMLYRKTGSLVSTLLFLLLGFLTVEADWWLSYGAERIIKIPYLLLTAGVDGTIDYAKADAISKDGGVIMSGLLIFWLTGLPLLALAKRGFHFVFMSSSRKKRDEFNSIKASFGGDTIIHSHLLPDWNLTHLRHDHLGRKAFFIFSCTALACIIGMEVNALPSFIVVTVLPCIVFRTAGRWLGRRFRFTDVTYISAGSLLFWSAQYFAGTARIALLAASAALIGYRTFKLIAETRRTGLPALLFLFVAILLPSMALGYNQYTALHTIRLFNHTASRPTVGTLRVKSADGYGLRDRYGMIIPAVYDAIEPISTPYKLYAIVRKGNNEGLFDYGHTHDFIARTSTITPISQRKAEQLISTELAEKGGHFGQIIVMDAQTGDIKVLATAGNSRIPTGKVYLSPWQQPRYSRLIRPFSMLATLQNGKMNLTNSVETGNGILETKIKMYSDNDWAKGGKGRVLYGETLRLSSDIALYKGAEKAFGEDADALFRYLNQMGADGIVTLYDEMYRPVFTSETQVKGRYTAPIHELANGYGLKMSPLQIVRMYSLLANGDYMVMPRLYASANEYPKSTYTDGIEHVDSLRGLLNGEYLPKSLGVTSAELTHHLAGYSCVFGPMPEAGKSEQTGPYYVEFCGYLRRENSTYVIYAMMECSHYPISPQKLSGIIPRLAEYIY